MKTKNYIVLILLFFVMIFAAFCVNRISIYTAYKNAITLIQNGSYEAALNKLEKANDGIIDRKDFDSDMKKGTLKKCYKNSISLYSYTLAQLEYNSENKNMSMVNKYLGFIPADYDGELSEEIKTFKKNFKPQYDEYLAEQKRKSEEARAERLKREQEFIASLKNKIPYEGMNESYINSTIVGKADKHDSEYIERTKYRDGYRKAKYIWYADNNDDIVLVVECKDGKVTDVIKYYDGVYWASDGTPKFWASKPKITTRSSSNNSKKKKDPYNVNDYSDPEDFYEDNYDDFWDYEDAEDYYDSYHD